MEQRKSALALTVVFLLVAWVVAMFCIAALVEPGDGGNTTRTPGELHDPWWTEQQERYADEAWQQFSH
jgi:hypothetical protein